MVNVIYGPNGGPVEGNRSVADFRSVFSAAYNIPDDAKASINGTPVYDENTVPPDGSKLVFSLGVGSKG